ncbi:unnamed protein product [Danaus chrysippus]|uniref:(African queen) hypothetical protein n=1 Tax=Danaus chrysippus TaxID=151541 RepID=A0A8J2QQ45_9NEOP|nr:unnamed protein product [Danaus chrysippus]
MLGVASHHQAALGILEAGGLSHVCHVCIVCLEQCHHVSVSRHLRDTSVSREGPPRSTEERSVRRGSLLCIGFIKNIYIK